MRKTVSHWGQSKILALRRGVRSSIAWRRGLCGADRIRIIGCFASVRLLGRDRCGEFGFQRGYFIRGHTAIRNAGHDGSNAGFDAVEGCLKTCLRRGELIYEYLQVLCCLSHKFEILRDD